jgi:hypothetical protein
VLSTYCAAGDRETSAIYFAKSGAFEFRVGTVGAIPEVTTGYDATFGLSAWTYSAGTTSVSITDAERGDWTPRANDWVSASIGGTTYYRRISAPVDAGASYTFTIDSAFPAGAQSALTAYEAIVPVLEWQPLTAGDPFTAALWSEMQVMLDVGDNSSGPDLRFELGAKCERTTTSEPTDAKSASEARSAVSRVALRAGLDREVGRANSCAPWLKATSLLLPWHCHGVMLKFQPYGGDGERGTR